MVVIVPAPVLKPRLAASAREVAGSILRSARAVLAEKLVSKRLKPAAVLARLDVPIRLQAPEAKEWACIRADHAAMTAAGEWDDLLEAMRFADQSRSAAAGGKRVAVLMSEGTRAKLTAAIAKEDWTAAEAEIKCFEAVFDASPTNYVVAHLVAQAHLDLGNAQRALALNARRQGAIWKGIQFHTTSAETVLDQFDPIEEASPLLAGTRYQLARGIEDGRKFCLDWYEDWCDLDPTDAEVHAMHARMMLPQWFGNLSDFSDCARKAVRLTEAQTGCAAYAVMYLAGAEILGEMPPGLDIELFLDGLADYQAVTGCQYRANICAGVLASMMQVYMRDRPLKSYELGKVRKALAEFIWNRITEFHLSAWQNGRATLALTLSEIFGAALENGSRIVRQGSGLGTCRAK